VSSAPPDVSVRLRRLGSLLAVLLLGGCASAPSARDQASESARLVEIEEGSFSWAGIRIGASRREVQRALGRSLTVDSYPGALACGGFATSLTVRGRAVRIQWSAREEAGTVDSILIPLTKDEAGLPVSKLKRPLMRRFGAAVSGGQVDPEDRVAYLSIASKRRQGVLIKSRGENFLYLAWEECLD
jgi:hypothetical protein